jgi:hypothetical protein
MTYNTALWNIQNNYMPRLTELVYTFAGKKISLNNVLMELRKCCNHPVDFLSISVYELCYVSFTWTKPLSRCKQREFCASGYFTIKIILTMICVRCECVTSWHIQCKEKHKINFCILCIISYPFDCCILYYVFMKADHALQANLFLLFQYLFPGQEVNQLAGEDVFLSLVSASGKLQLLQKVPLPTFTSYLGTEC